MPKLSSLRPALFWKHFKALSAIPRISLNENAAGDYVVNVARLHGLEWQRDDAGNVLVRKPARPGYENRPRAILQSHLDMVGEKIPGSAHDFSRDPIQLVIDGEWLRADGTTLGADNGVGVAASLAILESTDIPHGPLAALFTVEEEIGLRGASRVRKDFLDGGFLINMDSDDPAELTIGCAGALDLLVDIPIKREPLRLGWTGFSLELDGLLGGHSGVDIQRGRGNALHLMARILDDAGRDLSWRLISLRGGNARNAIPRAAYAECAVQEDHRLQFHSQLEQVLDHVKRELSIADPGIRISLEKPATYSMPLSRPCTRRLLSFLRACPTGVYRNSDSHAGVVETSGNLAIFNLAADENVAKAQLLLRSLVDSAKLDLAETISALAHLAGGTPSIAANYPGWAPNPNSQLTPLFAAIATEVLGKQPAIAVVHAGLECGILRAMNPSLDCISCGARIKAMHSPDEQLNIASVEQLFEIVSRALARLPARV